MEIGVFSKCVKDLIINLDEVDIPGLGVFFAEDVPATFSDKGNTINPPTRRMFFRRQEVSPQQGETFFKAVSESLNVAREQAPVELDWCLSRIHSELSGNKSCILPNLGEMKASSNGEYFFIPDEELDICPDSFGLEPVCVKPTFDIVTPKPEPTPAPAPTPAPTSADNQTPLEQEFDNDAKTDQKPEQPVKPKKPCKKALWIIPLVIIILIALVVAACCLFPEEADKIIDKLLYTSEELEILGK